MSLELIEFKPREARQVIKKNEEWRSPKFVAEFFEVSLATVCRWGQRPVDPLPRKKNGNVVRIEMNEAKEWWDRNGTQ